MKQYLVGGAVRDILMGLNPKDLDYVIVGSTPEEMLAAGFKQVGADFPVFLDEAGTEYALARTERKNGNGYNGFITDHSKDVTLEDDLERRDLTINAMAMDGLGSLIDPYGGSKDLECRMLRHVSDAFKDDPVRVLRLARFHARFGPNWAVATETINLARDMAVAGELDYLTRERVLKELEKALSEPYPYLFFKTLKDCFALDKVLPELAGAEFLFRHEARGPAKFRYALLTTSVFDVDAFEERLNVSTEWKRYAKMFRSAFTTRNISPVTSLYQMDAYRQVPLWEEMMKDLAENGFSYFAKDLIEAWAMTKDINFYSLPVETRHLLKGPEIGAAIRLYREEVYAKHIL